MGLDKNGRSTRVCWFHWSIVRKSDRKNKQKSESLAGSWHGACRNAVDPELENFMPRWARDCGCGHQAVTRRYPWAIRKALRGHLPQVLIAYWSAEISMDHLASLKDKRQHVENMNETMKIWPMFWPWSCLRHALLMEGGQSNLWQQWRVSWLKLDSLGLTVWTQHSVLDLKLCDI